MNGIWFQIDEKNTFGDFLRGEKMGLRQDPAPIFHLCFTGIAPSDTMIEMIMEKKNPHNQKESVAMSSVLAGFVLTV